MRLRRTAVTLAALIGFGLTGTLVACGSGEYADATVAEDCDLEDQRNREDDCGYWQNGDRYVTGANPGAGWVWYYWTWVVVGQLSTAPAGWKAPHGLKAPTRTVRVPRKNCALGAGALEIPGQRPRPPAPAPKPAGGGGAKPPAGGNAPKAPAKPQAPVYKPPAGTKVKC